VKKDFYKAIEDRRSIYGISKEEVVSDEKILEIINHAVTYTPTAFNSQSGRVLVLFKEQDWGPPLDERLSQEEIGQTLAAVGFKDVKYHQVGEYFYGVVAEK